MDEKQIDKLPVYQDGKFKGLFSLRQVLHHVLVHGIDDLGLVADVMRENMKDRVIFVARSATLESIVKDMLQHPIKSA